MAAFLIVYKIKNIYSYLLEANISFRNRDLVHSEHQFFDFMDYIVYLL